MLTGHHAREKLPVSRGRDRGVARKIAELFRLFFFAFALSLCYWLILVRYLWNNELMREFRYIGF